MATKYQKLIVYVPEKKDEILEYFEKEIQLDKGFAKLAKKNNLGVKRVPTSNAIMRLIESYNKMRNAMRAKKLAEKESTE